MRVNKDEEVVRWTLDQAQSEISFQFRHLMISHIKGDFSQFEATVLTNGKDFSTADISLNIKSESIDTNDLHRDARLKGSDFLCSDQHKQITFSSTFIAPVDGNGRMMLLGELKIGGIARNVSFDMHLGAPSVDLWGHKKAFMSITGKITREDWNLHWTSLMEAEGFLIGDEIIISCNLHLVSLTQHDAHFDQDPVAVMRTV